MSIQSNVHLLVIEFIDRAVEHAKATRASQSNRAALRLAAIYGELRSLGAAGGSEFLQLVAHDNEAVRLWAATYALEFFPTIAEPALEALATGAPGPTRASASATLREWRSGHLKFPSVRKEN